MRRHSWLAAAAVLAGSGSMAFGQTPNVPTTVQLPTFHVFTVQTTVSVPDRGGLALGGITRGADGKVVLGPLGSRGSSSSRGAGGVSATATIIDNRELDEVVLASAVHAAPQQTDARARELARGVAKSAKGPMPGSVAAIREQNAAEETQRSAELEVFLSKGQQAQARGQAGLAKTYYSMVARRASGEVKQRAEALLVSLATGKSTAKAKR